MVDVDRVLEQNNYTNQLLYVVATQIENSKGPTSIGDKTSTSKYNSNIEVSPIFKIPKFSRENFPELDCQFSSSLDLLEKINDPLLKLKFTENPNSVESPKIRTTESSELTKDPKPTEEPSSSDTQFEENFFLPSSSHDGGSITEWNIDGLAEHQTYNKINFLSTNDKAIVLDNFLGLG
ncbi:hypothetical protein P3L10_027990 [Capsicum annuum]